MPWQPRPDAPHSMSRREALLAALAAPSLGCDAGSAPPLQTQPTGTSAPPQPLKLDIVTSGRMGEDERGGSLVVLLHGWAARGSFTFASARAVL